MLDSLSHTQNNLFWTLTWMSTSNRKCVCSIFPHARLLKSMSCSIPSANSNSFEITHYPRTSLLSIKLDSSYYFLSLSLSKTHESFTCHFIKEESRVCQVQTRRKTTTLLSQAATYFVEKLPTFARPSCMRV